jgi:hypothetical protein
LSAPNARDRCDHIHIIPAPLPPPFAGEGRVGAPDGLLANDSAQLKHRQPSK